MKRKRQRTTLEAAVQVEHEPVRDAERARERERMSE
jgi:hypothetical protein